MSAASQPGAFHAGFGEKLKHAREALGLTSADVAAKLKLGARQIEALEAEDLSQLPGEVFTRGFVRNYARLVEIDPELLIVPVDIHAAVAETITAPSEGVIFSAPGLRRWVLLPLLALGFFVLLVALLYYWLRQGEDALVSQPVVPPAAVPIAPTEPMPATPLALPHAGAPESVVPADVVPSTPEGPPPPVTPAPAAAPAPAMAAPPPVQPVPASPAAPADAPAGKTHTLRFAPALDAWIQVVDGQGKRYSKLVRAGSAETFLGEPPFKLVVGEAAQVHLSYDGHPIDLTPYIGQKVARLTLE